MAEALNFEADAHAEKISLFYGFAKAVKCREGKKLSANEMHI
jgi:hypothetical protein